jgi:hypothetical protein
MGEGLQNMWYFTVAGRHHCCNLKPWKGGGGSVCKEGGAAGG